MEVGLSAAEGNELYSFVIIVSFGATDGDRLSKVAAARNLRIEQSLQRRCRHPPECRLALHPILVSLASAVAFR